MRTISRTLVLVCVVLLALSLTVGAASATEAGGDAETPAEQTEGGEPAPGEESGSGKLTLPERPHDRVGLLVLAFIGAGGALALVNARKQLRGDRPKASGEFRWR